MVSFGNNLNESSIKTSVFADEMNTCLENFSDYKGEITKTLTNMTGCSSKLGHLFVDFFQGVKQIEKMIKKNSRFEKIFNDISNQIHLIRKKIQKEKLANWQISDERLLSIINKFTVFSHKKIADDMFDLGIEEGDAGGDLTLF
jgi:chromosome segregation ATPase